MVMDWEAKLILQRIKRPVGGMAEERMIFSFKLKEFHMTFSEISL